MPGDNHHHVGQCVNDGEGDDAFEGVGQYVIIDDGGEDDDATSMPKEFPGPTVVANSTWYLLGCVVVRAESPLCCSKRGVRAVPPHCVVETWYLFRCSRRFHSPPIGAEFRSTGVNDDDDGELT